MYKLLEKALTGSGYQEMELIDVQEGYRIYYEPLRSIVNTVIFVDAIHYVEKTVKDFKTSFSKELERRGVASHFMTILCVDSSSNDYMEELSIAKQVCDTDSFTWVYDDNTKELNIYEEQAEDFYGLKAVIENAKNIPAEEVAKEEEPEEKKKGFHIDFSFVKEMPKATSIIVLINVIVFVLCTFNADLLYNKGVVGLKLMTGPNQWYRIITAMFLHADITHIFSNMMLLYFLGEIVEKKIGTFAFTGFYFLTGISGTLVTFAWEFISKRYVAMIGASGAVFGILGILLALTICKKIRTSSLRAGRVFLVLVFSVYEGFTQSNVANGAHIGGAVSGILIGLLYCLITRGKEKGKKDED